MQRQSLGSSSPQPSTVKLHHHHLHGGIILNTDLSLSPLTNSPKHKASPPSSSPSSPTTVTTTKSPHRFSITPPTQSPSKAEKLIHLIPVFTLLCFLLLFLLSHNPSPSDMAKFKGVKPMKAAKNDVDELEGLRSTLIEENEMMNGVGLVGVEKGDVLGIRSFRNLQETEEKYRDFNFRNRKLGDF